MVTGAVTLIDAIFSQVKTEAAHNGELRAMVCKWAAWVSVMLASHDPVS